MPDFLLFWRPFIQCYLGASADHELVFLTWMPQKTFVGMNGSHHGRAVSRSGQYRAQSRSWKEYERGLARSTRGDPLSTRNWTTSSLLCQAASHGFTANFQIRTPTKSRLAYLQQWIRTASKTRI